MLYVTMLLDSSVTTMMIGEYQSFRRNDITGGNSGSPVLNENGELIGCAFDGNWESLSGDINFDNNLQRCINLDIRYVLFILEKLGNCGHLINEMTIVE